MAYTQADLDAIRAAIVRGEKSVQFADRLVVYRSLEELRAAENIVANAVDPRPKQTLGVTRDWWDQ